MMVSNLGRASWPAAGRTAAGGGVICKFVTCLT
jgi:hypothetical protein